MYLLPARDQNESQEQVSEGAKHLARFPFGHQLVTRGGWPGLTKQLRIAGAATLGLVIEKSVEVFLEPEPSPIEQAASEGTYPLAIYGPGQLLVPADFLDRFTFGVAATSPWSAVCGARTVVTHWPTGRQELQTVLKRVLEEPRDTQYSSAADIPKIRTLIDDIETPIAQWVLLSQIANAVARDWKARVLFITFDTLQPRDELTGLAAYLFQKQWPHPLTVTAARASEIDDVSFRTNAARNRVSAKKERNVSPFVRHVAAQALRIASGSRPGFRPATENEDAGPFLRVQNALVDKWPNSLERAAFPVILVPAHVHVQGPNEGNSSPFVYWSIANRHLPPQMRCATKYKKSVQAIKDYATTLTSWKELFSPNTGLSFTAHAPDESETATVDQFASFNAFAARHMKDDFSSQLELACLYGWTLDDFILKKFGFFSAFLRIGRSFRATSDESTQAS